jgi:V-type H+-transporting ATPase subunit a
MKQALLIGVIHMTFGICLQVWNHTYFKNPLNIWTEFLPQIIFMESIFGYLSILIMYKWSTDWYSEGRNPPNLLNTLIFMFLSPGNVAPNAQLYPGQAFVQSFLLLIAFICIPWMLIPKPYLLRKAHLQRHYRPRGGDREHLLARDSSDIHEEEDAESRGQGEFSAASTMAMMHEGASVEDEFDMSEIVVHQVIHTIEFCLGCISNTASYLRLWALSLAHARTSCGESD